MEMVDRRQPPGPEAMADLRNDLGQRGRPGSIEEAAQACNLVVVGFWKRLRDEGRPASDPQRLALRVASDDADAGQQPGSPVYNLPLTADGVRERLGAIA